jgi:hypothetical protein
MSSANEQFGLFLEATIYVSVADEEERADTVFHQCACAKSRRLLWEIPG